MGRKQADQRSRAAGQREARGGTQAASCTGHSTHTHTLRRTFASPCFFAGRDLRWVMGQLGHEDPRMTLGVYAKCMKRSQIDNALVWRLMRFPDEPDERGHERAFDPRGRCTPGRSPKFVMGAAGFEPATSRV